MLVWAGMGALICTLSEFVPNQPQILVLFLRIPAKMYLFGLRDFQKCDDESTNSNPRRSHVGTCRSDCHLDFVFPLSSTSFPRKVPILNSFAAFLTSQHLLRSYQATPYNSQRPLQQTVIFCCHSTLSVCILAEQRWQYEFVPNWSSSVRIRTQGNHRRYEFVPKGSSWVRIRTQGIVVGTNSYPRDRICTEGRRQWLPCSVCNCRSHHQPTSTEQK